MSRWAITLGALLASTPVEAADLVAEVRTASLPRCHPAKQNRLALADLGSGRGMEALVITTQDYLSTYAISFATPVPAVTPTWLGFQADEIWFADLDGDDTPELLAWEDDFLFVGLARLIPGGGFEYLAIFEPAWPNPTLADLDGRPGLEVSLISQSPTDDWAPVIFQRDSSGSWQAVRPAGPLGALMADYDGDGRPESFRQGTESGTWTLHRVQTDLTLSAPLASLPALEHLLLVVLGDVDGDGRADLVNWAEDGELTVRFGSPDARLSPPMSVGRFPRESIVRTGPWALGTSTGPVLLAEVDGTPGLEVVIDDGKRLRVLDPGAAWRVVYEAGWPEESDGYRVFTVGDVDGDGQADLVRAMCPDEFQDEFTGPTVVEAHLLKPAPARGGGGVLEWTLLLLAGCGAARRYLRSG